MTDSPPDPGAEFGKRKLIDGTIQGDNKLSGFTLHRNHNRPGKGGTLHLGDVGDIVPSEVRVVIRSILFREN